MAIAVTPNAGRYSSSPGELVEARLRLALDAAGMGMWDWDLISGEMYWDDRTAALFGTTMAESTGSIADFESRVHPDDLPTVRAVLAGAIEHAGPVDVEYRVVWPDGSLRWLSGRGQALVDATGAVVRLVGINVDISEQRRAAQQRAEDAERMAGLVAVAQALGEAASELEVLAVVTGRGVALLGARYAALSLLEADGQRSPLLTAGAVADRLVQAEVRQPPVDGELPMVAAALAGEASFFSDQEAAFAELSAHDALAFWGAVEASAAVPLRTGGRTIGALLVAFDHTQHWREPEQELVEALATLTAQALDRIRARIAEKQANAASRRLSETLQRSLLAAPPQYGDLQIAVRYQPAAAEAHVGGDWYDAFVTGDGRLMLVIGDVAGHDRGATAAMAQLRNLLRGVAQTLTGSPAAVLSGLDQALDGLQVTALATAVLTQIERCTGPRGATRWRLRWSNAGHPPPLLIGPQGRSELLERPAELPIGADSDTRRADHELLLLPGSSLILYTDGLIERRGQPLDDGFARLQEAVADLGHLPAEQLSDALLDRLGSDAEDDVALLVLEIPA